MITVKDYYLRSIIRMRWAGVERKELAGICEFGETDYVRAVLISRPHLPKGRRVKSRLFVLCENDRRTPARL